MISGDVLDMYLCLKLEIVDRAALAEGALAEVSEKCRPLLLECEERADLSASEAPPDRETRAR